MLPYRIARWVIGDSDALKKARGRPQFETLTLTLQDRRYQPVLLFKTEWQLQKVQQENPKLRLRTTAPLQMV